MKWWSEQVVRSRRQMMGLAVLFTVLAALWGTGVFSKLVDGGFDDTKSQSARAEQQLADRIGRSDADLILLVNSPGRTVDDPAYAADVNAALNTLPGSDVTAIRDYFTTHNGAFASADKHSTFVAITLTNPTAGRKLKSYDPMTSTLTARGYTARVGGTSAINDDVSARVKADIGRAESISMPILLVLLVIIFGSVVAASLPLLVGGISILGAFTALRVISLFTDVSVFAINIVTIMGLGLAIDYGLFMVGRFREELNNGHQPHEAARRTVQTAGRTVLVSAITVMVALAGLTLFPQVFLRSMGFGGMAAVLVAALAATIVLPAVLASLGTRIEKLPVRLFRRRRPAAASDESGFWYRLAHSVMRRPVGYLVASCLVLLVLAAPFLHVKFGGVDAKVLPTSSQTRQVSDVLKADFPGSDATPIIIATDLTDGVSTSPGKAALAGYLAQVKQLPSVSTATVTAAKGNTARIEVSYRGDTLAGSTKTLVHEIRDLPPAAGVQQVLVGGETAKLIDRLHSIGSILPWMGLLVGVATFVLLFLAFGSVVLPLKAIALNVLSLGASFGVVTWIFGDGHLAGLLNFTPTGTVEATQPILVLAIVFGLSMDYEVFLLSRVREQYDRTGDNRMAVATGLQRTGGIITSAALLIIVVIAAFSASSITFIKLIGVAMATGIVVDAVLVRMIVVPAAMRLMGAANWWAPKPLRGIYRRYGIRESDDVLNRELTNA
ncbi:MAG TPA: MMPL family transporter [Jatrophihabitans sp.]